MTTHLCYTMGVMRIKESIEVNVGKKIAIYQPLGYVYKVVEVVSSNKIVADYTGGSWDRVTLTKKNGSWYINGYYPVTIKWSISNESSGQQVLLIGE